jgi:hypothetical protein
LRATGASAAIQQREALIDKLKQNNLKDCIKYLYIISFDGFSGLLRQSLRSFLAMTEEYGLLCRFAPSSQ